MKNKQRTLIFHNQNNMIPLEDESRTAEDSRVPPDGDLSPAAESKIQTRSSEEDSVKVERLENKLYSVVELLEEAIKGHRKLRTEILPQQRFMFDQLCDALQKSLGRMKTEVEPNTNDVQKRRPIEQNTISDCSESRFADPNKCVTMYENSIQAHISKFLNWHQIWLMNLSDELQRHSSQIIQKLGSLSEEADRMDFNKAAFQSDGRQSSQIRDPSASRPDRHESGAIHEHHRRRNERKSIGHRIVELVQFMDKCRSNTLESPTVETDREVAEPKVLCVSVASASPVSSEQPNIDEGGSASTSKKLQQLFTALQQKQEEQSLSTVPNPQEVPAASQEMEALWKNIETHRVEVLRNKLLCKYMKTLVVLSLMVADKKLFYAHVLFCAQQLRNPAHVDELAVVTTSSADAHRAQPSVDWSTYKSSRSKYLLLLPPQEKRFYAEVTELKPNTLVVWCSAYACLLLRLSDRGVSYVRRQLSQLNRQLADAYGLDAGSLPRVPLDSPSFLDRLRKYSNYAVDPVHRNTLYKGLIERYEYTAPPQRTKKLLNFLLLTSLRYRGMSLITLVDECRKLYGISTDELVRKTSAYETRRSWQAYERFTNKFRKGNFWKRYKYCQVFCPKMYSDMHFDANFKLCSLLCELIDIRKLKNGCGPSTVLYHKVVERIRAKDDDEQFADETWKRKCENIVKKFTH